MYLGGVRTKGKYIKTDLANNCIELSEDKKLKLFLRLKEGEDVSEELLRAHLKLILNVSGRYANFFPKKTDDIVGEACLAATACLKNATKKLTEPYNISGWIIRSVHYGINNFLKTDGTITLPRWIKEKGGSNWVPKVLSLDDVDVDDYYYTSQSPRDQVQDLINKTVLSSIEFDVIQKVLAGWKFQQIEEELGVSQQYVSFTYRAALAKMREMGK